MVHTYILKLARPIRNASGSISFIGLSDNILQSKILILTGLAKIYIYIYIYEKLLIHLPQSYCHSFL